MFPYRCEQSAVASVLQSPESFYDHLDKNNTSYSRSDIDEKIIREFIYSNIEYLQLIENLVVAAKQKIVESNFTYTPPASFAILIQLLPALKPNIELFKRAVRIQQESEAFVSELSVFGVKAESIKILQDEGIVELYQLKRLTNQEGRLDRMLLKMGLGLPISEILVLEDFMQWVDYHRRSIGYYEKIYTKEAEYSQLEKYKRMIR